MTFRDTLGAVLVVAVLLPARSAAQQRPVVTIDAGHGGPEAGVQHEGLVEKDLVLRIALTVGAEFVERGWDVHFTRTGDWAVAWDDRRRSAEEAGASLLLMLHINGEDDRSLHGAEIYANVDDPGSAGAAASVAAALRDMGSAVVEEGRPWEFLRSPTVPTVMIELAYMTHPVERRLLLSEGFHHELGAALADAAERIAPRS